MDGVGVNFRDVFFGGAGDPVDVDGDGLISVLGQPLAQAEPTLRAAGSGGGGGFATTSELHDRAISGKSAKVSAM